MEYFSTSYQIGLYEGVWAGQSRRRQELLPTEEVLAAPTDRYYRGDLRWRMQAMSPSADWSRPAVRLRHLEQKRVRQVPG